MSRKLVWLAGLLLALPLWAAGPSGVISGTVRDSVGMEQAAARVELFTGSSLAPAATVFTNAAGFFKLVNLAPGIYDVRVFSPSFLPAVHADLSLRAGAALVLNITLNSLFEAVSSLAPKSGVVNVQEDWKWVLRSTANRPLLRLLGNGGAAGIPRSGPLVNGEVSFMAGSDAGALGNSYGMSTAFTVERAQFASGTLVLGGNVGYGGGAAVPDTLLRAAYSRRLPGGSEPRVAFSFRRVTTPETTERDSALQTMAISAADQVSLDQVLELRFGAEYQMVRFGGMDAVVSPFGSLDLQLSPGTVVEYQYATALPPTAGLAGEAVSSAGGELAPRVSLTNAGAVLERPRHQEISLTRYRGKNRWQLAWYHDHFSNPALTGIGDASMEPGDLLPDSFAGTFTATGPDFSTSGVRAVLERRLTSGLTAAVDYSFGGVLALAGNDATPAALRSDLTSQNRHALSCKLSGTMHATGTRWMASYQWINGTYALTQVDMFDASAGQAEPYLSIYVRQPIPSGNFMPVRMEALIDLRNLLAQGYVPIDGSHSLFLAESARVFRGGLAFTF